jgi:hypothetical protein
MFPNNLNGHAIFKPMAITAVGANYTPNANPSFYQDINGNSKGAPTTVTLPTTQTTSLTTIASMTNNCFSLKTINNVPFLGNTSTASTTVVIASSLIAYELTTLDFYCKFFRIFSNVFYFFF